MTDVTAAPKGFESYSWFKFTGEKPLSMTSQGGSKLVLKKGSKFGVRDSSNKKFIRMVGEETGPNKVFTLPFDEVNVLIHNCKPVKSPAVTAAPVPTAGKVVKLVFVDRNKNNSVVCVSDKNVWAFIVLNKDFSKGQPENLSSFMFNTSVNGYEEQARTMRAVLITAYKQSKGDPKAVLKKAMEVTRLPAQYWYIRD